jgi:hypothetical protein
MTVTLFGAFATGDAFRTINRDSHTHFIAPFIVVSIPGLMHEREKSDG